MSARKRIRTITCIDFEAVLRAEAGAALVDALDTRYLDLEGTYRSRLAAASGTAHDVDSLVERPLFDEVLAPFNSQQGAHGRVGSINRTQNLRLDFLFLPRNVDQHDITHLKALHDVLHRHETSVIKDRTARSSCRLVVRMASSACGVPITTL